jgi:hypothetical protein
MDEFDCERAADHAASRGCGAAQDHLKRLERAGQQAFEGKPEIHVVNLQLLLHEAAWQRLLEERKQAVEAQRGSEDAVWMMHDVLDSLVFAV